MATVRYLVQDVDRAVAFYTTHLGFELVEHMGSPFAQVRLGDLTLWLAGPQSSAARPMPDGAKPVPGGWNRLVIQMSRLADRVEELKNAGVHFRNELLHGVGGTQILLEDGEGNVIELFEPRS